MEDDKKTDDSRLPDEDDYLKDEFIILIPKRNAGQQNTEDG